MSDEPLTRVGDYQVLGVLGAGGMGKVYQVRNVITERIEAMKILLPDLASRRDLAERFLREIKLLASLNHPHIAALRTAFTWDNQLAMIMEYVEGVTLAALVKQGPLPPRDAVNYADQVLDALNYAHARGIIHRDIKPANMMLTPQGMVKLMDFGIARSQTDPSLTATGATVGSLHYMAPEQMRGEPADARSDIYSLGVSLYELVTGQRPFQADSDVAIMAAHLTKMPPAPIELRHEVPASLNSIILLAMAKEPAQRFQTAGAFRNALKIAASDPAAPISAPAQDQAATMTIMDATPPRSAISAAMAGSAPGDTISPVANASALQPVEVIVEPQMAPRVPQPLTPAQPQPSVTAAPHAAAVNAAAPSPHPAVPSVMELATMRPNHSGVGIAVAALVIIVALLGGGLYLSRAHKRAETPRTVAATAANRAIAEPASAASGATDATPTSAPTLGDSVRRPQSSAVQSSTVVPRLGETAANRTTNRTAMPQSDNEPVTNAAANIPPRRGGNARPSSRESRSDASPAHRLAPPSPPPQQEAALRPPKLNSPSADEFAKLEHDLDLLSARADAVNTTLDTLRQTQAAQGVGLRGDITSSQQRMRTYLARAQSAFKTQDASGARKYLELADTEVTALEKFLGH